MFILRFATPFCLSVGFRLPCHAPKSIYLSWQLLDHFKPKHQRHELRFHVGGFAPGKCRSEKVEILLCLPYSSPTTHYSVASLGLLLMNLPLTTLFLSRADTGQTLTVPMAGIQ